jgi:Ca2+-binding RTX toxin-like protein
LATIEGTTFAEIMARNSGVDHPHLDAFHVANKMTYGNGNDLGVGADIASVLKADLMIGGAGNDSLSGGEGSDTLYGDAGNDSLAGGNGDDYLRGGDGKDALFGGSGNDNVGGGSGNDLINLGDGDDWASGGDGNDTMQGGNGADTMLGDAGNDVMNGGSGDDVLFGGDGNDVMWGEDGSDLFMFGSDSGMDIAHGGQGGGWIDSIQLSGAGGEGSPGIFGSDWTLTLTSGHIVSQDDHSITLSDDADGFITFDQHNQLSFTDMERIEC